MRAALIFSSTSHSINVQKVVQTLLSAIQLTIPDLQDCSFQSIRLKVYNSRNRKRRRASPVISVCLIIAIYELNVEPTSRHTYAIVSAHQQSIFASFFCHYIQLDRLLLSSQLDLLRIHGRGQDYLWDR